MAEKISIELEAKFDNLQGALNDIENKLDDVGKDGVKAFKKVEKEAKDTAKATKGIGKALSGVGAVLTGGLFKAGAVIFEKLLELFTSNQRVVDALDTAMNALKIVFGDFVSFLDNNIGNIVSYFQAIFNDPLGAVKDFAESIKNNLIVRFNSLIETFGLVGKAVKKLFAGDWDGASEAAAEASLKLVDSMTGVENSVEKIQTGVTKVAKTVKNYAVNTAVAAKSLTDLNKQAQIAEGQNALLLQQYDKEAELQRQIRDDTSKSIADRIKANEELGKVLDRQAETMEANAKMQLDAAKQALALDKENLDLQLAVIDKKRELADVEATVTGFRSEQLINEIALQNEQKEAELESDAERLEAKQRLVEVEKQRKQGIMDSLDAVINAAGAESKVGKALFLLKQGMIIKEQIMAAKATMGKILSKAAEATVDGATGFMKAAAAAPPPANIPLIAIFAAQAAGIAMSIKSAVSAAKGVVGKSGGGGGGSAPAFGDSGGASQPAAPAFNVVGAAPENQLAETIAGEDSKPTKAYVVSQEVTTSQALNRNIVEGASIG